MQSDIKIILNEPEIAGLIANYIMERLRSPLPMSSNTALNLESELAVYIEPQINYEIKLRLINGKLITDKRPF